MEDLDQEALDIAKKYLLERWTLKELAGRVPPVTGDPSSAPQRVA